MNNKFESLKDKLLFKMCSKPFIIFSELLPDGTELGRKDWIFQQDGTEIHTVIGVKNWFHTNKVLVLPWPVKRSDLNVCENVWVTLVYRFQACPTFE